MVFTDACHAGKLAGSTIGGAVATAENLARQFANEVKILSCQPNEFSVEGVQWGGGRGVFSWHLLDGLTGLADRNTDGAVNLMEIGRYLEDQVPAETAPLSQIPMIIGDRQALLARVNAPALAALQTEKASQKMGLTTTDPRGFEDIFLSDVDSLTRQLYAEFKLALQNGELLDAAPGHRSADDLYRQLPQNPALDFLEQSFERYCPRLEPVLEEPLFRKLRKMRRFEELVAQYFPDKK